MKCFPCPRVSYLLLPLSGCENIRLRGLLFYTNSLYINKGEYLEMIWVRSSLRVMSTLVGVLIVLGLGKTIQVIAFLTAAFGKTGDERDHKRMRKMRRAGKSWYPKVLLICPGSLLKNWRSELERWGWWHVDIFHGSGKQDSLRAAAAGNVEILITTYNTYEINKEAINNVEWDVVIADECHQIKNRHAAITKAMNEINALCRIGLTGTALQNNYDELWVSNTIWRPPDKQASLTRNRPYLIGRIQEDLGQ